jgi:16S rRNA (guanine527-N7)-methyltransferase
VAVADSNDEHLASLVRLGVPTEHQGPLCEYLQLVAEWNERTNLTGARTPQDRVRVLVADPWRAADHVKPGRLIDVGSGNGSPGLVLALLRSDVQVVLLEPRSRRWAFLREAARHLGVTANVEVERSRSEGFAGPAARTVTLRAVGLTLAAVEHLVLAGGEVLVFGGEPQASAGFERMGRHLLDTSELHVFRRTATNVSRET